jgi:hypothetical protein
LAEAAYAYDRPYKALKNIHEKGRLSGMIKRSDNVGHLVPIESLQKVLGPFVREPVRLGRYDVQLYDRLTEFLIFTPIRAGNACGEKLRSHIPGFEPGMIWGGLRWRNIHPDRHGGIIEFLPRRRDPNDPSKELPSEHKLGWKFPVPYIVILTDNLRAIIEEQRQRQIRYGIKIEPDGLVFIHGPSRTGFNRWEHCHLNHRAVEDHLQAAADYLVERGIIKTKKITPHGLRTTFTTWAKSHGYGGYNNDLIDLSLGHTIEAIRNNKTNWHYFYRVLLLDQRRQMMKHWEQHCLSRCGAAASNIIAFPASA